VYPSDPSLVRIDALLWAASIRGSGEYAPPGGAVQLLTTARALAPLTQPSAAADALKYLPDLVGLSQKLRIFKGLNNLAPAGVANSAILWRGNGGIPLGFKSPFRAQNWRATLMDIEAICDTIRTTNPQICAGQPLTTPRDVAAVPVPNNTT